MLLHLRHLQAYFSNSPANLGVEKEAAWLLAMVHLSVCNKLVEYTLLAQSRGANEILCKINRFTIARDFQEKLSGWKSCVKYNSKYRLF